MNIRRNDIVVVMAGKHAGAAKTGKVLQVFPERGRAIVEGVNLVKKALRKSQDNPKGGISSKESSIAISNLMLYCAECKRGVRISRGRTDGKLMRKCKKCGHAF